MKKLLCAILIAAVLFTSSTSAEDKSQEEVTIHGNEVTTSLNEVTPDRNEFTALSAEGAMEKLPSASQNDLVYHDYGSGVELSDGSSLSIPHLELELESGDTAIIVAFDMKDHTRTKICDYESGQKVVFAADKDSVYQLLAIISNGDIIDLTPDAAIATNFSEDNNYSGFIKLR